MKNLTEKYLAGYEKAKGKIKGFNLVKFLKHGQVETTFSNKKLVNHTYNLLKIKSAGALKKNSIFKSPAGVKKTTPPRKHSF